MERAKLPDSSLSLILRNPKQGCLQNGSKTFDLMSAKKMTREKHPLSNSQKLAVRLRSRVKSPLPFLPGDFTMIPGHLLVGRGGDQLLQLRSLTDDGLLHGFSLRKKQPKEIHKFRLMDSSWHGYLFSEVCKSVCL